MDKIIERKNTINFAKALRLGRYGHIERKQDAKMVKAIHSWKHISKGPAGRPKIRWDDDVRKDTQRMNVPNWRILVQDRRRWTEVAEKTETLH